MEVVVVFEGGDTDKPMILGSLYNGTHPPPFQLPADKTRSGWRTQSSPGGAGNNELSFQDATGAEQIYLHATRNLDEVVEKNHTSLVKQDEFIRIIGDRMDAVERNLAVMVGGNATARVTGDQSTQVDGNRMDAVTGNFDIRVTRDLTTRVAGTELREVIGAAELLAKGDVTQRVRGSHTTLVGSEKAPRSFVLHVEGVTNLSSSGITEFRSDKALVLSCGRSSLRITDDKIELVSPATSTSGPGGGFTITEDSIRIRAKGDAQLVAETILLKTPDASLALGTDVQIDGKRILLNSPQQAKHLVPDKSVKLTRIELVNQHGKPLANRRYLVKMGDGSEVGGILDRNGKAEVELEGAGTISFPDLRGVKAK